MIWCCVEILAENKFKICLNVLKEIAQRLHNNSKKCFDFKKFWIPNIWSPFKYICGYCRVLLLKHLYGFKWNYDSERYNLIKYCKFNISSFIFVFSYFTLKPHKFNFIQLHLISKQSPSSEKSKKEKIKNIETRHLKIQNIFFLFLLFISTKRNYLILSNEGEKFLHKF